MLVITVIIIVSVIILHKIIFTSISYLYLHTHIKFKLPIFSLFLVFEETEKF